MVDKMVKQVAEGIAGAFYENVDVHGANQAYRSDKFRKSQNKSVREWVRLNWPEFVPLARKQLAAMLNDPGRLETDKQAIFDALLRDRKFMTDSQMAAPHIIHY